MQTNTQNTAAAASTLPANVTALSWKETLDLFKRLNGGTVGFDYGQYRLQDLRNVLAAWVAQGVPADVIAAHAAAIVGERSAKATIVPPAPAALAVQAAQPMPPAPAAPTPAEQGIVTLPPQSVRESLADAIARAQALTALTHPATVAAPQAQQVTQPPGSALAPDGAFIVDAFADAALHAAPAPVAAEAIDAPAPTSVQTLPPGRKLARDVFADIPKRVLDCIPPTLSIPVFAHADAEAIDPSYRFQADTLIPALIAMSVTPSVRVWCGGARGTGKTEFIRALAARTGRALFRVSFNRFTEASEIIGDMGLTGGATVWQDGPVAAALRVKDGSAVLLLDEITYGSAGALACLNGLLEQRGAAVRLPRTGEALPVHPDLFVAACDNTFGAGNDSGEYQARNELGADTRDRFGFKLLFNYLPETDERELLREGIARATGRKPSAAAMKPIMGLLKTCRAKADSGELQGAPSFRGAVAFATLLAFGCKPADAWTLAVVLGAPESSHEALRQVFTAVWPVDTTGNLQTFQGEI